MQPHTQTRRDGTACNFSIENDSRIVQFLRIFGLKRPLIRVFYLKFDIGTTIAIMPCERRRTEFARPQDIWEKENSQMNNYESLNAPTNNSRGKTIAISAAFAALLAGNVYSFVRIHDLESGTSQWNSATSKQFSELRDAMSASDASGSKNLATLRSELDEAKHQSTMTAGRAKVEALKHADQLAKQLAEAQQLQQQKVTSELTEMKESTNTKFADVSTDVAATKVDVASTKADLQNTVSDLKRMTGDMGVMSGRIATNGTELEALRALGERNYFEFNIVKSKLAQKVGNIQLVVRKADPKRNRFTIDVMADDKTVEKRDRTINEPVQFYVSKARQPYEIVVNEVSKDRIVGYLATPKVVIARN